MKKNYLKVISLSLLIGGLTFSNAGCNAGKAKVTFVTENNSDIVRYIKKGKTLVDIPEVPSVKGKYCAWEEADYKNIRSDMVVNAICYSTVTNLSTNMPNEKNVEVSSKEADLDYMFKDLEIEVTFESGEKKKLYKGDYTIVADNYDKDKAGTYKVKIVYNNAKQDITINVGKIKDYVTVSLTTGVGYYNEGLPKLVPNTDVQGYATFDKGQSLTIGTKAYAWTFTPLDTDKYEVVHGNITVELVNITQITSNKDEIYVDYGTTKEEVINMIRDGLVVEGKYSNINREIDPQYYTITSSNFLPNISDKFEFKIAYNEQIYTTVDVFVGQCDTYNLRVDGIEEVILKEGVTLDSLINKLTIHAPVNGELIFKEDQRLIAGNYEYSYIFTPNNINYAVKEGKIRIPVYEAKELEFTYLDEFNYGTQLEEIIRKIKASISGTAKYNNSYTKPITPSNVEVTVDDYDRLNAGVYQFSVDYNGEMIITKTFTLKKRYLANIDYKIHCDSVDPTNYQSMPLCYITKEENSEFDFDPTLFSIIPLLDKPVTIENNKYVYHAELVPHSSISNNYERVELILKLS